VDKNQFKSFCKVEFEKRGFKKVKNIFFLAGFDLLCGIDLQKSSYGKTYYINYYFFIGDFRNSEIMPFYFDSDVQGRIIVMSKTQKIKGEHFRTAQIRYEDYTEDELRSFFDKDFAEKVLPPVYKGKAFILNHLNVLYFLTLRKDEVLRKLKGN